MRTATQMDFADQRFLIKQAALQHPFLKQSLDVRMLDLMVFCDALVAAAKRTHAFAKRQVDVKA